MPEYSDAFLKNVLRETRVIAMVGVSPNPVRPSNFVARYLGLKGFRVIPVNPVAAGQTIYGEVVRETLADVPVRVDMVDIFRSSEHVPAIVDEALAVCPGVKTIWMQIGVLHDGAAGVATEAGLQVVQDRCPKIEYQRLFGELRMGGFNTGVISSKL